jgi:lipopolysaccharide/colanic/teichoic acid biosynthesis glycosyltransferase/NDP-sugar pyrophosphorylase family protein
VKAIVLSCPVTPALAPLADAADVAAFPLALPLGGEPLLQHLLRRLITHKITETGIVVGRGRMAAYRRLVEQLGAVRVVRLIEAPDEVVIGPAGALAAAADFAGRSPVLAIRAGVLPENVDLTALVEFHGHTGASVTAVLEPAITRLSQLERAELDDHAIVRGYTVLHSSQDRRRHAHGRHDRNRRQALVSAEMYVVDPRVYPEIPRDRYVDIKEQLLPLLRDRGHHVRAYSVRAGVWRLSSVHDYLELDRRLTVEALTRQAAEPVVPPIGENVRIAPTASVVGPVIIGRDCMIDDECTVVGPATIGDGVVLGPGTHVRESTVMARATVAGNNTIARTVVGEGCRLSAGQTVRDAVVLNSGRAETGEAFFVRHASAAAIEVVLNPGPIAHRLAAFRYGVLSAAIKRLMDVAGSLGLLVALAPLMALIAVVIRLTSKGPAIFAQRRCGRHGVEFTMYKFRTMVDNADAVQWQLAAHKDVDGPMFKMGRDPRVTPFGSFLRKTSLDELPQLVNVLKGDMSLVGPRPLVMQEMRFAPHWRDFRLLVKPGISGLWQVSGRATINAAFHNWIQYDITYVKRQSLLLDLVILLKTLRVLRPRASGAR